MTTKDTSSRVTLLFDTQLSSFSSSSQIVPISLFGCQKKLPQTALPVSLTVDVKFWVLPPAAFMQDSWRVSRTSEGRWFIFSALNAFSLQIFGLKRCSLVEFETHFDLGKCILPVHFLLKIIFCNKWWWWKWQYAFLLLHAYEIRKTVWTQYYNFRVCLDLNLMYVPQHAHAFHQWSEQAATGAQIFYFVFDLTPSLAFFS